MKALWSLEYRIGQKWVLYDVYDKLKYARGQRDWSLTHYATRIRKWVRP